MFCYVILVGPLIFVRVLVLIRFETCSNHIFKENKEKKRLATEDQLFYDEDACKTNFIKIFYV